MFDQVFGEIENDFGYVAKKKLFFWGVEQEIDVHIDIDVDGGGEIAQVQRDAYEALMQNWDEMQHKIAVAILQYYNEEEKGAYGPDDPDEFAKWWPDIVSEEDLIKYVHLDTIIIPADYIMEIKGANPVYILFGRDWGDEDLEDNGVAVLIEDGEVSEVGYKYIAY